jgi:hypothetical protein
VRESIFEKSEDILDQVIAGIKSSPNLALHLGESTGVASHEQLLVYARYLKDDPVKKEFLFYELLTTTACKDMFRTLKNSTSIRDYVKGRR